MTQFYRFTISVITAFIFFAATGSNGFSQTIDQTVAVDSLQAGDLFDYSITLKKDQSYDRVIYPDSTHFNGDIELRNRQQYRVSDFKDSLRYQLQFWATEDATIPALPVKLVSNSDTTTIMTEPVTIGFKSVLQSDEEELRPLKPIFDFAAAWWPYIAGLMVLLLAGALLYYFYKQYQDEPEAGTAPTFTPQPFLNPLKELENNLRQLKDISLTDKEHFQQYYVSLGDAIRLYFEQMYDIPALESTSREIIYELDRRAIDERLIEQTRIVFREADMVKFANFTPTQEKARESYKKAEEFLVVTKEIHGPRIQQMCRQHLAKVEQARKNFNENQKEETQS